MTSSIPPVLEARVLTLLPGDGWRLSPLVDSHNLVLRARRDGDDVVVRLQPQSRMNGATAQALVDFLRTVGRDPDLQVPRPVRLTTNEWVAEIEHAGRAHRCFVVTWVAGDRAQDARAFVQPGRLGAVGETVARLHAHAQMLTAKSAPDVPRLGAFLRDEHACAHDAVRDALPHDLHAQLGAAYERMATVLERQTAGSEVGLVHADLEPQNWVFDEGRPGVIDFDELRFGAFAVDLLGVLWTHAMWDELPVLRTHLFDGYERVRPLPSGTREDADVLMGIQFAAWLDFIFRELSEDDRARHLEYVQPMVERIVAWCGPQQSGAGER